MIKDTKNKLSPITVSLHWIVGLTILTLLGIGIYMTQTHAYALYPIHKSFGVIIFAFILMRVVWRLYNGWPEPASQYKAWVQRLSRAVHYVLIIGSIIIPVSGMIMSGMGGHGISVFGWDLMARNLDPLNPEKTLPVNADMARTGAMLHQWVSYTVIAALFLHISGALKHHLIDGDSTLKRMFGKKI